MVLVPKSVGSDCPPALEHCVHLGVGRGIAVTDETVVQVDYSDISFFAPVPGNSLRINDRSHSFASVRLLGNASDCQKIGDVAESLCVLVLHRCFLGLAPLIDYIGFIVIGEHVHLSGLLYGHPCLSLLYILIISFGARAGLDTVVPAGIDILR